MVLWNNLNQELPVLPDRITVTSEFHENLLPFLKIHYAEKGGFDTEINESFLKWIFSVPHICFIAWIDDSIIGCIVTLLIDEESLTLYLAVKEPWHLATYLIRRTMTLIKKGYYFGKQSRGKTVSYGVSVFPQGKITLRFPKIWSEKTWTILCSCPDTELLSSETGKMLILSRSNGKQNFWLLVLGEGTLNLDLSQEIRYLDFSKQGFYMGFYEDSPQLKPVLG